MIERRRKRDPLWEGVYGGITRDGNDWAKIWLGAVIEGQNIGYAIGIKHERILDPDRAFRRTLDQMTREVEIKIKYRGDK